MSFSFADAVPLARRMHYAALLASLGARRLDVAEPCAPLAPAPAANRLATVILGRAGWREAAADLGGCFASLGRQPL